MLEKLKNYNKLYDNFKWSIPEKYNIGVDICDRLTNQHPDSTAIIDVGESGQTCTYSFSQIKSKSNQLANALAELGPVSYTHLTLPTTPYV